MAHETLTPWEEVVLDSRYPMSIDELLALPGFTYPLADLFS